MWFVTTTNNPSNISIGTDVDDLRRIISRAENERSDGVHTVVHSVKLIDTVDGQTCMFFSDDVINVFSDRRQSRHYGTR